MALMDENGGNGLVMPVAPMGNANSGFGGGDWSSWIVLFLLFGMFGGWGGNGFGGGWGGNDLYPWMNQSNQMNDGFRGQMINGSINQIQSGVNGISNQLCNGFAGVNQTVANGFAQAEIANNARQMADMNQSFGMQTAMSQGFNGLSSQFADCCCENRLGIADLKYTVATENCADRTQSMQNTRDIIDSQTRGTQAVLDKLCQLELDGVKAQVEAKNDRISELQSQLNMANLAASQSAQNALIQNGFANEVDALYNRLNSCPVPTTPVYGRTPIFTCNNGCGCGNM